MTWLYWILALIVLLVALLVGLAFFTALRPERPVGFQVGVATTANGQRFPIGIFYPTQTQPYPTTLVGTVLMSVARDAPVTGSQLPLVVFSHGNGGGIASHADLALALASAGYVVAIPQHAGDNYADQSAAGSLTWLNHRSDEYRATLDYLLTDWPAHAQIAPTRVGAFGFSAGGFTVLTAIGAQPDLRRIASHCAETPEFACELLRQLNSPLLNSTALTTEAVFAADPRIKAAVIAAPGLAFAMPPAGLQGIQVPVQLWHGDQDNNIPYATNIQPLLDALGPGVEFHSVAGAGHFSFLAPCGPLAPPAICAEQPGFDRKSFHATMNASVIQFFEKNLPQP